MDPDTLEILENNYNFTLSEDINGPLLAAVIGIEMLAGLITNSFVLILTFCCSKNLKQPSTIFLTNFLFCNLVLVLFVMPFSISTGASGRWIISGNLNQKVIVCTFTAFILWYSITLVTFGLVIIAFDRFFFVVKAVAYKQHMSTSKAVCIVVFAWLLAGALNTTPFYGLGNYSFIACCGVCVPKWAGEPDYIIYILIIYITCITSIVVASIWTCLFTRKFLSRDERRTKFVSQNSRRDVYSTKNTRLVGLFGMIVIVHVVCYTPGIFASALELFVSVPVQLYTTMYVMFLLVASLSPLVQSFFRRDIREAMERIICCKKPQRLAVNRSFLSNSSTSSIKTKDTSC